MQNIVFFTEKCIIFLMLFSNVDYYVQNLTISVTNGFQTTIEGLKICSSSTFHVSYLLK